MERSTDDELGPDLGTGRAYCPGAAGGSDQMPGLG